MSNVERWAVRFYSPDFCPVEENFSDGRVARSVWPSQEGALAELGRLSRRYRAGVGIVARTQNREATS